MKLNKSLLKILKYIYIYTYLYNFIILKKKNKGKNILRYFRFNYKGRIENYLRKRWWIYEIIRIKLKY
jgi:hypothetical protein